MKEAEVKVAITKAVDEVRILGIEAGLMKGDPKVHETVVILTALLLLKERLVAYHEAARLGRPTFAPKDRQKGTLTV